MRRLRPSWLRRRREGESGYVAVVTVLMFASFAFGCAALAVDVGRMYAEGQQVQKAADVAALGAVTYLPQDMTSATSEARTISSRNGFPNSGTSTVGVTKGATPSQLDVTVCSTIKNSFAAAFGYPTATICRNAIADYSGPAPMGSPCPTFGNEPTSGSVSTPAVGPGGAKNGSGSTDTSLGASPFANCSSNPSFWATIEGPSTDKGSGDRYSTKSCANGTAVDGCTSGSSNNNTDYDQAGYFWLVRVQPAAVGQTVDLQLYDPEFGYSSPDCSLLPGASNWNTGNVNPYASDARTRYSSGAGSSDTGAPFCSGDYFPTGTGSTGMVTSFALRQQSDNLNPRTAPIQNDTSGNACIKQYAPQSKAIATNDLTKGSRTYDDQLSSVFHNWTSLCRFTPTRAGDYYLQVRSNVSAGGASTGNTGGNGALIYSGNSNVTATSGNVTTGSGDNSFGIRAVAPIGYEKLVAVSGYDRMPIFANAPAATATFNLIRVLPGGAGKSISFSYFDVGDTNATTGTGSVQVITPTGTAATGCTATGGYAGTGPATLSNCSAPFRTGSSASNNGLTETIIVPIPTSYTCTFSDLSKCWYQVKVSFPSGASVTDITTWTASVFGEPVRLLE